jgi:sulfite reductase (NADPH) hemoprotein beta-component
MACVALPTCSQAMAEAERRLPSLPEGLETVVHEQGLSRESIVMRITGCPNGCARPTLAEIGLVGKNLGQYNVYLGGGFAGQRLGQLYRESLTEDEIVSVLRPMLQRFAGERLIGEHFGDFLIRVGIMAPARQAQTPNLR